jgi:dTMP kinase
MDTKSGQFIVFEGIDGAGKSSYLSDAFGVLQQANKNPVLTREPGGTELGEQLRELLLNKPMAPQTECLLMFAARQQHLSELIWPTLSVGHWVLSDRFTDATFAYQGAGRRFGDTKIAQLESWVQGGFRPDHVLLFDLSPDEAQERRAKAREADKFEQLDLDFFNRVRDAYLSRAQASPHIYHIINTAHPQEVVRQQVVSTMQAIVQHAS